MSSTFTKHICWKSISCCDNKAGSHFVSFPHCREATAVSELPGILIKTTRQLQKIIMFNVAKDDQWPSVCSLQGGWLVAGQRGTSEGGPPRHGAGGILCSHFFSQSPPQRSLQAHWLHYTSCHCEGKKSLFFLCLNPLLMLMNYSERKHLLRQTSSSVKAMQIIKPLLPEFTYTE